MGRNPIKIELTVTSSDDDRFAKPKTFYSIPKAAVATGFSERGIRSSYHSEETSMKKGSGEVYMLEWREPFVRKDPKKCVRCSETLSFKDKSRQFYMNEEDDEDIFLEFRSLYTATRKTGISICALRNACEKTNETITRRKFEPIKYEIIWDGLCKNCFSQ